MRAHLEAENRRDFAAALEVFDRPRYELVGTGRVYDGRAEVERYLRDSRSAFPDQRSEVIRLYHADDAVVVELWLMGTHLGDLHGMPPSGKAFRCRAAALFLFERDRLVCERVYFDSGTIARQLA